MRQTVGDQRVFTLVEPLDEEVEGPALRGDLFASPAEPAPRKRGGGQKQQNESA